jgi:hypothetical protein
MLDAVKGLRDRQHQRVTDADELFERVKQRGTWDRPLEQSLVDLARAEAALGDETGRLVENQFKDDKVIAHIVREAADAMTEVQAAVEQVRAEPPKVANLEADRAAVQGPQKLALRRLDQLIDALKPEEQNRQARGGGQGGQGGQGPMGGDGGEGGGGGGGGDGVPPLAQLKLLRALQAEVNESTEGFAKAHPDPAKLTDDERAELDKLRRSQADLAALFDELSPAEPPPEPMPGEKKQ